MAYVPVYESRINWENYPSTITPLNDSNLNKIDYAVYQHDRSFEQIFNNSIKRIDYNTTTKVFVFTYWDGHTEEVNFALEQIPATFSLDRDGVVHMIDNQGNEYTADLKEHIYYEYIEDVDVEDEGEATDTTFARKIIIVNDVPYEIPGSKHMRQTVTLSTEEDTDVVFINNVFLDPDISVDVYTEKGNLLYDSIDIVNNECHIVYAKQDSEITVDVEVYIK